MGRMQYVLPLLSVLVAFTATSSVKAQELTSPDYVFDETISQVDFNSEIVPPPPVENASLATPNTATISDPDDQQPVMGFVSLTDSNQANYYRPISQSRGIGHVSDWWRQINHEGQLWHTYTAWGMKPGSRRVLGDGQLMVPLWQTHDSLIFADVRGQTDDNENYEGNWGLAYRTFMNERWIFGAYGFYDLRRTQFDHDFSQGTLGIEALSVCWDVRANLYIPDTSRKAIAGGGGGGGGPSTLSIVGNSLFLTTPGSGGSFETAYMGFDAEIGRLIKAWGCNNDVELRAYVGAFHFDTHISGMPNISGPRARAELRLYDLDWIGEGSRLTAGVEYQWDQVRDSQVFGMFRLRIPLGKQPRLDPLRRRMLDRIERDIDVVSNSQDTKTDPITELAADPANGDKTFLVVDATTEDVEDTIEDEIAGMDRSILLVGEDSTASGGIVVASDLFIYGGSSAATVTGATSGTPFSGIFPGARGSYLHDQGISLDNTFEIRGGNLFLSGVDIKTDDTSGFAGASIIRTKTTGDKISVSDSSLSNVSLFLQGPVIDFDTGYTGTVSLTAVVLDSGSMSKDHINDAGGASATLIDGHGNTTLNGFSLLGGFAGDNMSGGWIFNVGVTDDEFGNP